MAVQYVLYVSFPRDYAGFDMDKYPVMTFYESVDLEIARVIEIWPDGHTGIARLRDMLELGGAGVPDQLLPENFLLNAVKDQFVREITQEQFERYWRTAIDRIKHELGVTVTD